MSTPRPPALAMASTSKQAASLAALGARRPKGSSSPRGGIFGESGGSGPLLRAALLILAVVLVLVLLAKNCTGSDNAEPEFEDAVIAGVASVDEDIVVIFEGRVVTLSGEIPSEAVGLEAVGQATLQGAEAVINELVVVSVDGTPSADPALQADLDVLLAEAPIEFQSGSTEISEASIPTLGLVADAIIASPGGTVTVVGYTDSLGDDEQNLIISEQRATAVRIFLIDAGVDVLRITSEGRGEADPIADNETAEGQAANRRIEIIVL